MSRIASTVVLAAVASTALAEEHVRYDDHLVVRAQLDNLRELRTMMALGGRLWSESLAIGSVDFMIDADRLGALERTGIDHEVLIEDVQSVLDAERARLEAVESGLVGASFFEEYQRGADIIAFYEALAVAAPELVTGRTIGLSSLGRPIRAYTICGSDPETRPGIYVNTGAHAREWIGPATIAYFADQLVNGYGVDQRITDLVDGVAWQIVPLANPDGYEHTWDVDRLWRKTRRDNGDGTRGVDWNRNFSAGWGGPGSSGSTNSDIYRGTAPFSEPETQAIRADVLATPNLAIFLDVHCYSQLVLWPYGYDETEPAGPAGEIHRAIGIGIADAIASVNGVDFTPQAAHDLYLASGTSPDWGWDEAGAYSFTYELRDTGQFGFILPPDQIVPSGEEITESLLWTGEQVLGAAGVSFTSPLPAFADPASVVDVSISIVSTFTELDPSTALMVVENSGAVDRIPMSADAEGVYTASFLTGDCGSTSSIVFEIETIDGVLLELASSDGGPWQVDSIETETVFQDDAETDLGWTLGVPEDDATTGIWTRVDPNGTAAAPEDDDSDSGTLCFVTGQGSVGGGLGENDVDGGRTTLVSPVIPLDGGTSTERAVSFSLWYSNDTGAAPNSDSLLVETRWDGGSWLPLAEITESDASWRRTTLALEAPVAAPTSLEIRFIARDLGDGSLVEAAIDEVRILQTGCGEPECPGDLNEDGRVDGGDVGLLLSGWGGPGAGDLDGDGTVGGSDIGLLLSLWGDC